MTDKGLGHWIFRIIKYFCFAYAIVGLAFWTIGIVCTDYPAIHIDRWMVGDDGSVGYEWMIHDKSWEYFDHYTYPFAVLSLPIYISFSLSVSEGNISFLLNDIFMLYLIFIPFILLYFCGLLKNIIRKLMNKRLIGVNK